MGVKIINYIRLIDGLLEAESGEIWIDKQLLSSENAWTLCRQIGRQFSKIQITTSVRTDDKLPLAEKCDFPREEMKKRVADSLELAARLLRRESQPRLSGGQKQRVAIKRSEISYF